MAEPATLPRSLSTPFASYSASLSFPLPSLFPRISPQLDRWNPPFSCWCQCLALANYDTPLLLSFFFLSPMSSHHLMCKYFPLIFHFLFPSHSSLFSGSQQVSLSHCINDLFPRGTYLSPWPVLSALSLFHPLSIMSCHSQSWKWPVCCILLQL